MAKKLKGIINGKRERGYVLVMYAIIVGATLLYSFSGIRYSYNTLLKSQVQVLLNNALSAGMNSSPGRPGSRTAAPWVGQDIVLAACNQLMASSFNPAACAAPAYQQVPAGPGNPPASEEYYQLVLNNQTSRDARLRCSQIRFKYTPGGNNPPLPPIAVPEMCINMTCQDNLTGILPSNIRDVNAEGCITGRDAAVWVAMDLSDDWVKIYQDTDTNTGLGVRPTLPPSFAVMNNANYFTPANYPAAGYASHYSNQLIPSQELFYRLHDWQLRGIGGLDNADIPIDFPMAGAIGVEGLDVNGVIQGPITMRGIPGNQERTVPPHFTYSFNNSEFEEGETGLAILYPQLSHPLNNQDWWPNSSNYKFWPDANPDPVNLDLIEEPRIFSMPDGVGAHNPDDNPDPVIPMSFAISPNIVDTSMRNWVRADPDGSNPSRPIQEVRLRHATSHALGQMCFGKLFSIGKDVTNQILYSIGNLNQRFGLMFFNNIVIPAHPLYPKAVWETPIRSQLPWYNAATAPPMGLGFNPAGISVAAQAHSSNVINAGPPNPVVYKADYIERQFGSGDGLNSVGPQDLTWDNARLMAHVSSTCWSNINANLGAPNPNSAGLPPLETWRYPNFLIPNPYPNPNFQLPYAWMPYNNAWNAGSGALNSPAGNNNTRPFGAPGCNQAAVVMPGQNGAGSTGYAYYEPLAFTPDHYCIAGLAGSADPSCNSALLSNTALTGALPCQGPYTSFNGDEDGVSCDKGDGSHPYGFPSITTQPTNLPINATAANGGINTYSGIFNSLSSSHIQASAFSSPSSSAPNSLGNTSRSYRWCPANSTFPWSNGPGGSGTPPPAAPPPNLVTLPVLVQSMISGNFSFTGMPRNNDVANSTPPANLFTLNPATGQYPFPTSTQGPERAMSAALLTVYRTMAHPTKSQLYVTQRGIDDLAAIFVTSGPPALALRGPNSLTQPTNATQAFFKGALPTDDELPVYQPGSNGVTTAILESLHLIHSLVQSNVKVFIVNIQPQDVQNPGMAQFLAGLRKVEAKTNVSSGQFHYRFCHSTAGDASPDEPSSTTCSGTQCCDPINDPPAKGITVVNITQQQGERFEALRQRVMAELSNTALFYLSAYRLSK